MKKFSVLAPLTPAVLIGLLASSSPSLAYQSQSPLHETMEQNGNATKSVPIQSPSDLDMYLQADFSSKSPLDKLSLDGKRRFLDSLVFTKDGLAGFAYGDLVAELDASEIYAILQLFGFGHATAGIPNVKVQDIEDEIVMQGVLLGPRLRAGGTFLEDYKCVGKGTCEVSNMHACTSNC